MMNEFGTQNLPFSAMCVQSVRIFEEILANSYGIELSDPLLTLLYEFTEFTQDGLDQIILERVFKQMKAGVASRKAMRKLRGGSRADFIETIELQIDLRGLVSDGKRIRIKVHKVIRLPHITNKSKICVFHGGDRTQEVEKISGVDQKTTEELKSWKRNKKKFKRFHKRYDVFLCSSELIGKIPRLTGPTLSKARKFPLSVEGSVREMVDKVHHSLKVQMTLKASRKHKKILEQSTGSKIGLETNTVEELIESTICYVEAMMDELSNLGMTIHNWQHVKAVRVKATQGRPFPVHEALHPLPSTSEEDIIHDEIQ